MSRVVASRRLSPFRFLSHLLSNVVWLAPLLLAPATAASATTYTVTTLADSTDANCTTPCSLRDAITAANLDPGSTIVFTGLNGTITLGSALPSITANTTITGPGAGTLTVSGAGTYPAFSVVAAAAPLVVSMSGLTVSNTTGGFLGSGYGSGLFLQAPSTGTVQVTVTSMVFSNNAGASGGSAITNDAANLGTLNVVSSTFSGNTTAGEGAAIWNGGTVTIKTSTFSSNVATTQGSAIYNVHDGTTTFGTINISDSTFANNTATDFNGAIYNDSGPVTISNTTFAGNVAGGAPFEGASIANGGTLTLTNDVFVEPSSGFINQCTGAGCPTAVVDGDVNGNFDDTNANLILSGLGYHGGLTQTLIPLPGSPLLCGGNTAGDQGITTDQRGLPLDASCTAGKLDAGSVQVNFLTVTNTNDTGAGSLRAAITSANTAGAGDITFAGGVTGTITIASELPEINSLFNGAVVNIIGPGAGSLAISGNNADRIIINEGTLSISGVTLENGNSATTSSNDDLAGAGAILNAGSLTLDSTVLTNNTAGNNGTGGAVYGTGGSSLTVNNSTFSNNSVGAGNGGAIDSAGNVAVTNSTFSANTAGEGAGIFDETGAALNVSYSTFANNTTSATSGGAIFNVDGPLTVTNDTFAGNTTSGTGSDISNDTGALTVTNTILGTATGCFSNVAGCPTNKTNGNIVGDVALALTPLGTYGGPTQTILSVPGSSSICGGLQADIPAGSSSDQRGFAQQGPGSYGVANCVDSGSVQTDYTGVAFSAATYNAISGSDINFPPVTVYVNEIGQSNSNGVGGVPITLIYGGAGTVNGGLGPVSSVSGVGSAFTSLNITSVGTADPVSVSVTVVGADTLTAAATLNFHAASVTTTTTANPATTIATAASVALSATVSGSPTVNSGYVTFTIHQGSATGAVVGTATVSAQVNNGAAAVTYALPGNLTTGGTYVIVASYADVATGTNSSSSGTAALTVNAPLTATTAVATTTLTRNHLATPFTPVTGAGGNPPLSYGVSPALPTGLTMAPATGQITGTPTVVSASTVYTVTVTDHSATTATATFSLTVNAAVTATQAVATIGLTINHAATPVTPVTGAGGTGALTYGVSPALPTGLTLSTTTGQITGTPTVASAATVYTVTVTDTNSATATATFTLTVNGVVTATQSVATVTLTESHLMTPVTPVTGSGGTAPLSYAVSPALPTGLTLSTTTGQITGTPTVTHAASSFTVTVTDANTTTATNTFTLTINTAVTATQAVATTTLTQNHLATPFTPVTGGGGTTPLSYGVSPALPTGLTMAPATGQITGTPTVASVATVYTVTVTDANSATATATFSLTVNGALTATQAIASKALTINHAATSFTPVTGSGGTAPLTYGIAPALPTGLTLAPATGAITGTPTVTSASTVYTVTVTDANSSTATATFTLTVNSAVTATQAVATTTLTQNHAATAFTPVTGGGGTTPLSYGVSPALPTGLTMAPATGAITGTPTVTSAATVYTVTVTDANGATATATFSLTVNTAVTATQAVATTTLTQNHLATPFTPVTGGGGTTPLSYGVSPALPTGLTMAPATGQITGTPTVASAATVYTVTVTDANSATATATFTLTVNGALTATQSVASVSLTVNHLATPVTPVTGAGGTAPLTYGVAPALPTGLTLAPATGQITGTPTVTSAATVYTVTVTDANSTTATATFTLTVNSAVTATQAVATTTLTQNHAATAFTPVTGGGGTAPLSYSVLPALPTGLAMAPATGAITGTPTVASAATVYTVTVTDANGATATATFTLTVNAAVTATQAVASTTLTVNHLATPFTPVTGGGGTAPLSYGVSPALPTGLALAPATGQITGTPTVASAATVYTVTVTDANGATATATFTLTVNGALTATQVIASKALTINRAATSFTPVTGAGGTAPLSYSVSPALPTGLAMAPATGAITGTPTVTSAATVYTVTVTDANSATATATFTLTVNSAVTATQAVPTTVLTVNHAAAAFTPVTGGGGTTPLSYGVSPALPTGLTMAPATGAITGTPTVTSAATVYTVTVTDANGATATATFSLTVSGAVSATTAVPTTTLTVNHVATAFTPVTGSGGTAPLSYSVAPTLPAGLALAPATGQITGTPTVASAATVYTVTVTDANSATATATFSLTVSGPLTATTAVPTTTLLANQAATPFTPVTGAGGTAPLSYGVSPALPAGLTMAAATGAITGTPTVTTNATVYTVTVTDANSATATATFSLTVNSATISITWANPSAITYGTTLASTLNATVTYNGNTVPGTFTYTATPAGGSASAATAATVLAAGSYTLTASFTPNNTVTYGTPTPKSVPLTVNQAQPTIAWTPAASIPYGTTLAALLNATASFSGNSVAGSFAYTATPSGGAATTVTASTTLVVGTYTLGVTFTPTDATDYKTATATAPLSVTGGTLTVTANNATRVYGAANPSFTGTITGQQNGDTFTESFTTNATVTSNVGTYAIVPSAVGANLSDYTVVVDDGTLTITQAGSTTTLVVSNANPNPGASVTLTATVASATSGTPTGTVSFYDGSTLLNTATLNGGVATYATTSFTSGVHTITAVYSGDTNFTASSTTSATSITVAALDFTITPTPTSITGKSGGTFTYQLAVAPTFGVYPGPVTFMAVTGVPPGATVAFTPTSIAANGGAQTVAMVVASSSAALQPQSAGRNLAPLALAFLLLPLAGTRRMRRQGRQFGRMICLFLLALGGVVAVTALSGCGSSSGKTNNNPQTYTITVTATSGTITHNTTVTLTLN